MASVQIGLVFVHVAANSLTPDIRRSVYDIVEKSSVSLPRVTNSTIRDAISVFVARGPPSTASSSADEQVTWNKHATLSSLLVSSVAFGPEADVAVREESVVEMLILAHHSLICSLMSHCDCENLLADFRSRRTFPPNMDRSLSEDEHRSKTTRRCEAGQAVGVGLGSLCRRREGEISLLIQSELQC